VTSLTAPRFWTAYRALPTDIRDAARKAYRLFRDNPYHPSLQFKRVHDREPIYSTRVTRAYRAVGLVDNDKITGFWIGTHDDYDRLLRSL
jgi:hypothetical protein